MRQPVQFLVDDRHQLLDSACVAAAPGLQKLGDLPSVRHKVLRENSRRNYSKEALRGLPTGFVAAA